MISTHSFLRSLSTELLMEYFQRNGHPIEKKDVEKVKSLPKHILSHLKTLPPEIKAQVDLDFESAKGFSSMTNPIECIYAEFFPYATNHPKQAIDVEQAKASFGEWETVQDKVFWTFLNYPGVFQNAYSFASADHSTVKYSSKLGGFIRERPKDDDGTAKKLAVAIVDFYQEKGKGEHCLVEILDREGVLYYFVSQSDTPSSETVFSQAGSIVKQIVRKTFSIIFWFNSKNGELSVVAKGGEADHQSLRRIFQEVCLSSQDFPEKSHKPFYDFNRSVELVHDLPVKGGDVFESVRIKSIKFRPQGYPGKIIVEASEPQSTAKELAAKLALLNGGNIGRPILENAKILRVEFEVTMKPGTMGAHKWTFAISSPDRCNLGDSPNHVKASEYLKSWKIDSNG